MHEVRTEQSAEKNNSGVPEATAFPRSSCANWLMDVNGDIFPTEVH